MTADDIRAQLEEKEREAQALKDVLDAKLRAEQQASIDAIVRLIDEHQLIPVDVVTAIQKAYPAKKRTRKPKGAPTLTVVSAAFTDRVTGQTYKRGPKPAWLKQRLAETGLDWPQYREMFAAA